MKTETEKSPNHSFALNEQELRRILDLLTQRIAQVATQQPPETRFTLRFRNGSVASPETMNEILSQENSGSSVIESLELVVSEGPYLTQGSDSARPYIKLEFRRVSAAQRLSSITYKILGNDRDWVL